VCYFDKRKGGNMPANKKTKDQDQKLVWEDLKWHRDLVGGTTELFVDCSFSSTLHHFTRGTSQSIGWRWGRPLQFQFTNAEKCLASEGKLRPWEKCPRTSYTYRRQGVHTHRTWEQEAEIMGSLWKRRGVFYFYLPDGVGVALYPVGVVVPKKPFFYQTAAELKSTQEFWGRHADELVKKLTKGKSRSRSTRK
jgi:hypothetical protein